MATYSAFHKSSMGSWKQRQDENVGRYPQTRGLRQALEKSFDEKFGPSKVAELRKSNSDAEDQEG